MLYRSPFDSWELRDEFRRRLNEIPGVDLPVAKVSMRPGFHVDVTIAKLARDPLLGHLDWFRRVAVGTTEVGADAGTASDDFGASMIVS